MDLIRELLLKLEALPLRPGEIHLVSGHDEELAIEGRSADEIEYHLDLIREAGFIESPGAQPINGGLTFQRLSWSDHDFLDSVRNPETWAKTKKAAAGAGGFTVDLLKDLAKGFIKKQVEERTGIKL